MARAFFVAWADQGPATVGAYRAQVHWLQGQIGHHGCNHFYRKQEYIAVAVFAHALFDLWVRHCLVVTCVDLGGIGNSQISTVGAPGPLKRQRRIGCTWSVYSCNCFRHKCQGHVFRIEAMLTMLEIVGRCKIALHLAEIQ